MILSTPFPILAIDAGNTRIKWGIYDGREWFMRGAFPTAAASTAEAFNHLPHHLAVHRILVSNVAGTSVANAIKDSLYSLGTSIEFIQSQPDQCGVSSRYEPANALGSDRWAALIAAHSSAPRLPAPQLVVMAGTALTVDALTAEGIFLGGIIAPGLVLMRTSLNHGTAQLPVEAGDYQTIPRNTLNAISTGAIEACCGAIQRMYTHLSVHTGDVPRCIASGGSIHTLSPHLPFPVTINENLVIDGLIEIAAASTT